MVSVAVAELAVATDAYNGFVPDGIVVVQPLLRPVKAPVAKV
jgi:hypothetical protein